MGSLAQTVKRRGVGALGKTVEWVRVFAWRSGGSVAAGEIWIDGRGGAARCLELRAVAGVRHNISVSNVNHLLKPR